MAPLRLLSSPSRQLIAGLAVVAVAVIVEIVVLSSSSSSSSPPPPPPPRYLESMFQDDDHLVYTSTAGAINTLDRLQRLGVDSLRVTVLWKAIAPAPTASAVPAGFDATNPASYPAAAWAPYDRLVALARARGIAVLLNLTAPGPLWAMARGAPSTRYADHWMPSAAAFGQFVAAVGRRYSGTYTPPGATAPLARVSYWSIWNEPNQPGWLAPQRQSEGGELAPALYRDYADTAWTALSRTAHGSGRDTFLIGELAPEGCEPAGPCAFSGLNAPIPPIPFLRALYCVDSSYRPLTGAAAAKVGCPQGGDPAAFVADNPGLFKATGFAHHPYSFFLAPSASMSDPNFVPLSDLPRLEHALDAVFGAYGLGRRLGLYLTEYGYETNPPNPFRGVSPGTQSLYLNQAVYMAWHDPRVRALSQFLLYDSPPDPLFKAGTQGYWSTFQTGLLYQDGTVKPAYGSYRLPLYVSDQRASGGEVLAWAMLRPAPHNSSQQAEVQWQPVSGGTFRTLATVGTHNPNGVLAVHVSVPGSGVLRVAWRSPSGRVYYSRRVGVRAG
jgi:hypothetical protein